MTQDSKNKWSVIINIDSLLKGTEDADGSSTSGGSTSGGSASGGSASGGGLEG